MSKIIKRGYVSSDEQEFGPDAIEKLYKARDDLFYLLNNGYKIKGASIFVGNHYLLSERQRMAIVRAVSSEEAIKIRKGKEITQNLKGVTVNIDGFNTIITLEVALSSSLLLKCMDGTIRDLAGLRGTYRLIDKTEIAIKHICEKLEEYKIGAAMFYLDAPVSNSGKLKEMIIELSKDFNFEVKVENINNVDSVLESLDNVITSDAIILDKCKSSINLNKEIIENKMMNCRCIDFRLLLNQS